MSFVLHACIRYGKTAMVNLEVFARNHQLAMVGYSPVSYTHLNGLFFVDLKRKICRQYVHSEAKGSIVDNSLKKVYVDDEGAIWVGTVSYTHLRQMQAKSTTVYQRLRLITA